MLNEHMIWTTVRFGKSLDEKKMYPDMNKKRRKSGDKGDENDLDIWIINLFYLFVDKIDFMNKNDVLFQH